MAYSESFILGIIGAAGGLISLVFGAMRKSRCHDIQCCWGMFKCLRENLTDDELAREPVSPHHHNNLQTRPLAVTV